MFPGRRMFMQAEPSAGSPNAAPAPPPPQRDGLTPTTTPSTTPPAAANGPGVLAEIAAPPAKAGGSDMVYAVPMDDGTTRYATIEQLADAYVSQVGLDPKDAEMGRLLKKAMSGDASATQQLTNLFGVTPATPIPATADPTNPLLSASNRRGAVGGTTLDDATKAEIEQLKQQLKAVSAVTENIRSLSHEAQVKRDILTHANELPFASQHPRAAAAIIAEVGRIEQAMIAQGQRTDTREVAQRIYAKAMLNVESQFAQDHAIYGRIKITPTQPSVTPDQGAVNPTTAAQAAKLNGTNPQGVYVLDNGTMIDKATGLPVRQTPTGELQIVTAPAPIANGMPVMVPDAAAFTGPVTIESMRAKTKARLAQLEAQRKGVTA